MERIQKKVSKNSVSKISEPLQHDTAHKAAFQFKDNRPEAVIQGKLQKLIRNQSEPIQMSRGSSQANAELIRSMGKAAALVDDLPSAKPHTKKGQGSGGGTDHQARNASVINKAKQDTMKAHEDPTMFSASRMRSDARGKEKAADAAEKRKEKGTGASALSDYEKAMVQASTTYKGDQESFDKYLETKGFSFTEGELDNLYAELN